MFLGKGAGEGLLLRGLAGKEEAAEASTSGSKSAAAGHLDFEGDRSFPLK